MRNYYKIADKLYLSLPFKDSSEKESAESQTDSNLIGGYALDHEHCLFGKIFVVGEEATYEEVAHHNKESKAEVVNVLDYSKFNARYWLGKTLNNQNNQVLLYDSEQQGRRAVSIDYSLEETSEDLKDVILSLFLSSRISPICIQVNTDNLEHIQLALDISLTIMVLEVFFENMIVDSYLETNNFNALLLKILSEKYSDIPGYDDCLKKMNAEDDDFSSRRFNAIFSYVKELYDALVDPELTALVMQNPEYVNAFKSPSIPLLSQLFEESVLSYRKLNTEDHDADDNTSRESTSASASRDDTKNVFRGIKINTLLNANKAIHETCIENTIPSLQKLKLIMLAVRNSEWMYLSRNNSAILRRLRVATKTRNAVLLGPNSVRSTAIRILGKIEGITCNIQQDTSVVDAASVQLSPRPSLRFQHPSHFFENVSNSKKLKFIASFCGNRSESKKPPNQVRDMIISDGENGAIMLGMLPISNMKKQRHEGVEILQEFSQDKNSLGLVVSVLEDFELAGSGLKYPTVSENFWRQHGVLRLQIALPDNINEFHQFPDPMLQAIFDLLEIMYQFYSKGDGIYIHCKAGRGRSLSIISTFIALYIIENPALTIEERARGAHRIIKRKRRVVDSYERKGSLLESLLSDALSRRAKLCAESASQNDTSDVLSDAASVASLNVFNERRRTNAVQDSIDDDASMDSKAAAILG